MTRRSATGAQHAQYVDAKDAGKTAFGAAKNAGQIDAVIRNTFIQGTLSMSSRCSSSSCSPPESSWRSKSIRGGGRPLSADEPVPSRIFAPSGMIPTAAEKEVQKQWDELPPEVAAARSVGTGAH